jgi:3-oxoacyl-[acyl-carrier protein] reductase
MSGTAIVTGAGSGIGRAIALRLAADGYDVVVNDINAGPAQAVAEEIGRSGGHAVVARGDVSKESDVDAIAAASKGTVEVLVNNAGHVHQTPFEKMQAADFDRMFAVHVRGTFLMMRRFLPPMLERGRGSIVNIASQLGQIGGIELVHYSGAKAAIIGMTKALAREVSARGVRVNAVAPGPIETPLLMAAPEAFGDLGKRLVENMVGATNLRRLGQPDEVAAAITFLASDDASYITGQAIGVSGGLARI